MQAYTETIFDVFYLIYAIGIGLYILIKGNNKLTKWMGIDALILGVGDSFHLIPRILSYFIEYDFTKYLGYGKLIASITMTIFYVLMYYIYLKNYEKEERKTTTTAIWILVITRMVLCLLKGNNWEWNDSPLLWGILRNVPFFLLGAWIVYFYYKERKKNKTFQYLWLYISLSFMFYLIVVLGSKEMPVLGMFMIPKTICYMLILYAFSKKVR